MTTLKQAKQRILNKWNWEDSSKSVPTILYGAPGIGKTALAYSLIADRIKFELEKEFLKNSQKIEDKSSEEYIKLNSEFEKKIKILNFDSITKEFLDFISPHCLTLRLAECPIEVLQGVVVPSLSDKDNFAKQVVLENIHKIKDSKFGLVLLDELDKCSDSKFAAATHLLENKIIANIQLSEGWYVIAAANREEDSHLSNPIPPEIRNRCANIEVEHDLAGWLEWAAKHKIRKDIMMFHQATSGEWLAKYDLEQTYSFPTPRSWTMASRIINDIELKFNKEDPKQMEEFNSLFRNELIDFVGLQAASEFFTYRELYLKFNIKEILDGSKRIARLGERSEQSVISDQCVAAFAMADQIHADMLGKREDTKFVINKDVVNNLITFIKDLVPEIRTLYIQAIHTTRIINIIMDSGMADDIMDEMIQYIAA